ncbi:MAG: hypothetical protein IPJ71_06570 [Bdellovibrionales bacterium]|nr:hypothetical protein [Bdellovibrionales bacterium]
MSSIEISYELGPNHPTAKIIGNIGERIDLYGMPLSGIDELTIDFKKVNYINSIGVKNWINWISRVPKKLKLNLINCIPAVINQLNSVTGFIPANGVVESFFIPYACDKCGHEELSLAKRGTSYEYPALSRPPKHLVPENIVCPKCGEKMEMDMLPMRYFSFLSGPNPQR